MNVVVGGSYHNPGWNYVKEIIKKLETAGHNVIAPQEEWEPINANEIARRQSESDKEINLKQIYLANPPFGKRFCEYDPDTLKELIMTSPEFSTERDFYLKSESNGIYDSIDEFIVDMKRFYAQVLYRIVKKYVTIGLESLIEKDKTSIKNDTELYLH